MNINCDIGENRPGYNLLHDLRMLEYVDICNLACGFHAGDPVTTASIIRFCKKHKVAVGAHPSFPDKLNFGRTEMNLPYSELLAILHYQVAAIKGMGEWLQHPITHLKAHGALYNMACNQEKEAAALVAVAITHKLPLLAPHGSLMAIMAAAKGVAVTYEAFADRNYNADLSLVSRKLGKAVIHDKVEVLEHLSHMENEGKVVCIDGIARPIKADSYCMHGDNPNALEILRYIRRGDS